MDYWLRHKAQFGGVILLLLVTIAVGFFPVSATAPTADKTLLLNSPVEATSSPEWAEYQYHVKAQYSKQLAYNQAQRKPAVKPQPKPAQQTTTAGTEQWRGLAGQYDWNVEHALLIMSCESGGVPTKHNYNPATRDNSWGLYQVNLWGSNAKNRPPASELVKPEVNIAYAYNLYVSQGRRFGTTGGWKNCANKFGIH